MAVSTVITETGKFLSILSTASVSTARTVTGDGVDGDNSDRGIHL